MLDAAGVISAFTPRVLDVPFDSLVSDSLFAGVTVTGRGPVFFWKKPAMLCCFGPDLIDDGVPIFFFWVLISLPSIPLAMTDYRREGIVQSAENQDLMHECKRDVVGRRDDLIERDT